MDLVAERAAVGEHGVVEIVRGGGAAHVFVVFVAEAGHDPPALAERDLILQIVTRANFVGVVGHDAHQRRGIKVAT